MCSSEVEESPSRHAIIAGFVTAGAESAGNPGDDHSPANLFTAAVSQAKTKDEEKEEKIPVVVASSFVGFSTPECVGFCVCFEWIA